MFLRITILILIKFEVLRIGDPGKVHRNAAKKIFWVIFWFESRISNIEVFSKPSTLRCHKYDVDGFEY